MNIEELVKYGKDNLISKSNRYSLCKRILKYLLNVEDTYLIINDKEEIDINIEKQYKENIEKLNSGIPIQYITKNQEFMGMDFYVDSNVLIPQPDTEILVEEIINMFKNIENVEILDLCTGSGAIGISLAKYLTTAHVTMADISKNAIEIAEKNCKKNKLQDRCEFIESDMFQNINKSFDIIVSNPPYIKSNVIKKLSKEVQNEPIIALDGGIDGLDFYKIIVDNAYKYLKNGGILALEIGYDQKEQVIELINNTKLYKNIISKKDLAGKDRVIICNKKGD